MSQRVGRAQRRVPPRDSNEQRSEREDEEPANDNADDAGARTAPGRERRGDEPQHAGDELTVEAAGEAGADLALRVADDHPRLDQRRSDPAAAGNLRLVTA